MLHNSNREEVLDQLRSRLKPYVAKEVRDPIRAGQLTEKVIVFVREMLDNEDVKALARR